MEQLLYSIKDLQKITGFSKHKIREYINCKKLSFINYSSGSILPRYKFHKHEVDRFLQSIQEKK
jgi:hypothetical protein